MLDGDPLSTIFPLILLASLQALCFVGEAAAELVSEARVKRLSENGSRGIEALSKLASFNERTRGGAFRSGSLITGFVASIIACQGFIPWICGLTNLSWQLAAVIVVAVCSILSLVISDTARRVFLQREDRALASMAGTLLFICRVFSPFGFVYTGISSAFARLFGVDPDYQEDEVTEEDIRLMIDEGSEDGTIDTAEQEMLHNIFEFDDLTVGEIMTHRTEMEAVYLDSTLEEIIELAAESGHSRLPVCGENLDDVRGVMMVKDLLVFTLKKPEDFKAEDFMRKVIFMPTTALADEALEQFRRQRSQLAIVVDEYGGTAGIVTMEDVIESIVGSIQDEYDNEPETFVKISDSEYLVDGAASLDDTAEELGLDLSDADDSYDTIAGYVIDKLHRIPSAGEEAIAETSEAIFSAEEIEEHRITKVRVIKKAAAEETEE